MVGYDEKKDHQLSTFWIATAGTISGILTRLTCQPLDVLKIRFQLQHEPLKPSKSNYYWNLRQAFTRILKEESVFAFWKGHVPAQLLSGVYGLAQFGTFEYLTKLVHATIIPLSSTTEANFLSMPETEAIIHFLCGSISGATGIIVSMPCDTVRTRLVGQGEPKIYKGFTHAVLTMTRNEGFASLYKGLVPNLLQIMPQTGIQFGTFHLLTESYWLVTQKESRTKLPMAGNLICGGIAGLTAKATIYPLDLIKKRLQVQGFEEARRTFGCVKKYSGLFNCFKRTLLEEGPRALYKGFLPSLIKATATSGLTFTFYEEITNMFILIGL